MARTRSRKPKAPRARKRRAGLPAPESVVSEKTFTSPRGTTFRILRTTEKDPYDDQKPKGKRRG
jgi:hypothetical protein